MVHEFLLRVAILLGDDPVKVSSSAIAIEQAVGGR